MPHKNPEERRAWQRKNYQLNKDIINSRLCKKAAVDRWRKKNADKCRDRSLKYYNENKEKMSIACKIWWQQKGNERKRQEAELLVDNYIKRQLSKDGFSRKDISRYPELIETKRIILKTKRL